MAHSGNTHNGNVNGVTEASWNTTQSMESKTNVQLRKLPVTIITGNRPCAATPASLFEGGRCFAIASSVQCFMNGFVVAADQNKANLFILYDFKNAAVCYVKFLL